MFELYYKLADLFRGTYTGTFIATLFKYTCQIGPYFLIAVLINAVLKQLLTSKKMPSFHISPALAIPAAGLFGMLSPMPTYLALPLGLSLLSSHVPFGTVAAFVIASPLLNPGIFILTLSQLGWTIALARLFSVLLLSVLGGFLVQVFSPRLPLVQDKESKKQPERRSFKTEFVRSLRYMSKYFIIALVLASFVRAFVPETMIARLFGGHAGMGLIAAMAMGVPFYTCGGAAIPLVRVLSEMGMHQGAVLTFLLSGPATKLETLAVSKSLLGFKWMFLYLGYSLAGSLVCGGLLYLF